jgi:hypothetical protein
MDKETYPNYKIWASLNRPMPDAPWYHPKSSATWVQSLLADILFYFLIFHVGIPYLRLSFNFQFLVFNFH